MDLDRIWRFELVRGFSRNPTRGACLLTAVSWLVYGQRTDRPSCVCPILAGVGRHVNDILNKRDRQRLKSFIWRLAESRDASAVERRVCILVDQVMLGILNGLPIHERVAAHFVWLRAVVLIALGAYRQAAVRIIFLFRKALQSGQRQSSCPTRRWCVQGFRHGSQRREARRDGSAARNCSDGRISDSMQA